MDLNHYQNKCVIGYSGTVGIWAIVGCREALDTSSLRDDQCDWFVWALYGSVCVGACYRLRLISLVDAGNPI